MVITCPKCEKKYRIDRYRQTASSLAVRCKACGSRFKVVLQSGEKIVCPNCGYQQPNSTECIKCGVIFSKLNQTKRSSETDPEIDKPLYDAKSENSINWMKLWRVCSAIYLSLIAAYLIVVFPAERNRPKRDRLYATMDQIDNTLLIEKIEPIKTELEDMIDRRVRKSHIYDFFSDGCHSVEPGVRIKKSNMMIKASFRDGTELQYVDRTSTVYLRKKKIPGNNLFKIFPGLMDLHTRYKEMDYDARVSELQEEYDYIDFNHIEEKYAKSATWMLPRYLLYGFLLWSIPACLGYIGARFKIWCESV